MLRHHSRTIRLSVCAAVLLAAAISAGDGGAPPVSVRVELDKPQIHIGERVRYSIAVESDEGVDVSMPVFGDRLGAFAIKDFGENGPHPVAPGRVRRVQWYLLDTFLLGSYAIPPARVRYRAPGAMERFIESPALFLTVEKLLDSPDAMKDVRDIQDVVDAPSRFWRVIAFISAVVAFIAISIVFGLYLFRRLRARASMEVLRLAHEIAYEQIDDLQRANLVAAGRTREYYFRLSEVVRLYVQNRFKILAPDMTTEEFLDVVARTRVLQDAHRDLVRVFLQHCDLVKFAKYQPRPYEIQEAYLSARRLVDETKEVIGEAATPPRSASPAMARP